MEKTSMGLVIMFTISMIVLVGLIKFQSYQKNISLLSEAFVQPIDNSFKLKKEIFMETMTPNYMLGLAALIISFAILFYVPVAYFLLKVRKNKKIK